MGLRKAAEKIVDTIEKNDNKLVKYGKYSIMVVLLLCILYFLYKKFGVKKPKRYF